MDEKRLQRPDPFGTVVKEDAMTDLSKMFEQAVLLLDTVTAKKLLVNPDDRPGFKGKE